MNRSTKATEAVHRLSPKIEILPVRHGSGDMAQEVRETLLARRVDCLAVPLPPSVEPLLEKAIARLPMISVIVIPESSQDETPVHNFVPVDPCQAVIMGIRVAIGEGTDRAYIDREVTAFEPHSYSGPDPYALKQVPLAAYGAAVFPFMPSPSQPSQRWDRITWMAFKLHELELEYDSILCLCLVEDWPWLRGAYQERARYTAPEPLQALPALYGVEPSTLYFSLGELPFMTELYERRRAEARSDEHVSVDAIKELLLSTRTRWRAHRPNTIAQEQNWVTPQLLQTYLQYVRNLALLEHRLIPDLYTLVLAAKQMAGDEFAITLLETAKTYTFQESTSNVGLPSLAVGLGQLEFPDGEISKGKNRLQGVPLIWRSLSLRPVPPKAKKRNWIFQWNPFGQCSWPPEDQRIEDFTAHVREQARCSLGADLARIDKFTTSMKDGIDLRETLRHWKHPSTTRLMEIYVKEIPPARGNVEVVVFLFEVPADPEKFSWKTTWYAEHAEESTLCFYATPFLEEMIGPGIGQSQYGGTLFLFPPRPIPNVWEDPRLEFTQTLEERLVAGAAAHSQESHIVLVSPTSPLTSWRRIVKRFQRRLISIPLTRFSGQTIDRLRHFHVLNGHEIRSYAAEFIRK